MPKCLSPAQIEQYREEGCVFPIRVMSEAEAARLRAITERDARILYRGTDVASYNEPKALAQRA